MKQAILCINDFSHSHCWTEILNIYTYIYFFVVYISVLYEYIYFSMHVQVNYYKHLHCCSFN